MNKNEYEEDLTRRQTKHLKNAGHQDKEEDWIPCLHDKCSECVGTGIKKDGTPCIHFISCPCSKCRPHMGWE